MRLDLQTAPDKIERPNQPGCRKLLQIGDSEIPITWPPVEILAPPGAFGTFRARLNSIDLKAGRVQVNIPSARTS
ncbi:MAG: hypothetical protein M3Y07_05970 [Acidobacteriota bacterium]|nr:hypothetical protein [Acidobacteriota bacterium]